MTRNSLPVLGVTGNSGSGKNTVEEILKQEGGYGIDADVLSHEAMRPGEPAYQEIVALFGESVLSGAGEIDRKRLGALVFSNRAQLTRLESILHRQVIRRTLALTSEKNQNPDGCRFIVWNAPLLIEAGMHRQCDGVWLISAQLEIKLARVQARDGVGRETAVIRLQNQMPEEKIQAEAIAALGRSRFTVIENNGGARLLVNRVKEALGLFMGKLK